MRCSAEPIGNGNNTSVSQPQDWEVNVWSVTPQLSRSKNNTLAASLASHQLGQRFLAAAAAAALPTTNSNVLPFKNPRIRLCVRKPFVCMCSLPRRINTLPRFPASEVNLAWESTDFRQLSHSCGVFARHSRDAPQQRVGRSVLTFDPSPGLPHERGPPAECERRLDHRLGSVPQGETFSAVPLKKKGQNNSWVSLFLGLLGNIWLREGRRLPPNNKVCLAVNRN